MWLYFSPWSLLHDLHPPHWAGMVITRMTLKDKIEDGRCFISLGPQMTVWSRECHFPTGKSHLGLFSGRYIELCSIWTIKMGYLGVFLWITYYYIIHCESLRVSNLYIPIQHSITHSGKCRLEDLNDINEWKILCKLHNY